MESLSSFALWFVVAFAQIFGAGTMSEGIITPTSGGTEEAVTAANCDTVCPLVWGANGVDGLQQPYELAEDSIYLPIGDACNCSDAPEKFRLDGSETP